MSTALDRMAAIEASTRAALPSAIDLAAPGWLCRISGGTTKRINSASPVVAGATLAPVRAVAERAYADHGLPPRFRLTPLADGGCDAELATAGYRLVDRSWTMAAVAAPGAPDPAVRLAARADDRWCQGLATASGWSAEDDRAHRAIVGRLPAGSVVATLGGDDGPLAFGAVGLGKGRACLFDVVVVATARGRGIGRRLVTSLLGWAAAQGHGDVILQVLADNAPARALYASLGFVDAYPYHYRVA